MAAGLSVELGRWRREFDELMLRVGGRFARVEPRRRMAAFVLALLAGLPRVNCWTIAEHAGENCPRGMQRLRSGMRQGSGMTCAATCWSTSPTPARCWWWTYADPGTMPRRVQRDGSALGRGGLLGGGRVAVLGIVTGFPGRPAAGLRDGSVLAVWTRGW